MMTTNMNDLWMTLLQGLVPVLLLGMVVLQKKATAFLERKVSNDQVRSYLTAVDILVEKLAASIMKTVSEQLILANADGTVTMDELDHIKQLVFSEVTTILSAESKSAMTRTFGDLNTYLMHLIDLQVGLEAKRLNIECNTCTMVLDRKEDKNEDSI